MPVPCHIMCEDCGDKGSCDIYCYCENNIRYYCCSKDKCDPKKNFYPDVDCKKNIGGEKK